MDAHEMSVLLIIIIITILIILIIILLIIIIIIVNTCAWHRIDRTDLFENNGIYGAAPSPDDEGCLVKVPGVASDRAQLKALGDALGVCCV